VIKMRFGVGDGSEHTLEEVGQSFLGEGAERGRVAAPRRGRGKRREAPIVHRSFRAFRNGPIPLKAKGVRA
jgi:hypothetical protein